MALRVMTVTFGRGGVAVGVQQLGRVAHQPFIFLLRRRQIARDVHEGDDGDVEGIAEPNETGRFDRRVVVQRAGVDRGFVGDDADADPVHVGEADHDVPGPVLLHLEELGVVGHLLDDLTHVVALWSGPPARWCRGSPPDVPGRPSPRRAGRCPGCWMAGRRPAS